MNIEEMIYNGASEEEIQAALNAIRAEKAKQEEALRKEQEAQQNKLNKEMLKAEGRAYLINAMIAYLTAFDLLPEDYDLTQEELNETEEFLKSIEDKVPAYIKLFGIDKAVEAILNGEEPEGGAGLFFGLL